MDPYIAADMIAQSIELDTEDNNLRYTTRRLRQEITRAREVDAGTISDLEAHIAMLEEERGILKKALEFYAVYHKNPNDGPWGASSDDYGKVAIEALKKLGAPR